MLPASEHTEILANLATLHLEPTTTAAASAVLHQPYPRAGLGITIGPITFGLLMRGFLLAVSPRSRCLQHRLMLRSPPAHS
jgi:hypothetical protein